MRYILPMKGYKFINLLFVNVREIETPSDTTVRALCHMRLFGFHVTPVCFSLRVVDFYTVTGCFLYPHPGLQAHISCISQGYASLISRAFFFSPDTFSPAMAQRYTIRPPHSTHSNGSRLRNCFTICA